MAHVLVAPRLQAQQDLPEVVRPVLENADRHRQAGRMDEAIAGYRRVLELDPTVVSAYVALGALHHQAGRTQEALNTFEEGLRHAPGNGDLLFNAAVLSLRMERLDEALRYCDGALADTPSEAVLHSLRGRILRQLGRVDEALEELETTVRLTPGDAQAHFRLGNLYHELERPDDAIAAFRLAIKRQRNLLPAQYNLGAVLFEEGRYDEALEAYRIALKPIDEEFAQGQTVDPIHARAYANLGAIHSHNGAHPQAVEAYNKSLTLDPEQPTTLYNLGYLHYQQGREDEAYRSYQRALALDRVLPMAYLHLGEIDGRRGDLESSVAWLERGLAHFDAQSNHRALLLLGESHQALGNLDKAEEAYRSVLADHPDDGEALSSLGRQLRQRGRGEEARQLLERALAQRPQDSQVALELAALVGAQGDRRREQVLYRQVLEREDRVGEMWPVRLSLAGLLLEEGKTTEAQEQLEPVVGQLLRPSGNGPGPSLPEASQPALLATYGLLQAHQGALAEAGRLFQRALAEQPTFPPALQAAAVLAAFDGKLEVAARHMRQALPQLVGEELKSAARGNLGQVLWLAGKSGEARPHLEAATAAFPSWRSPQVALGEILLGSRQFREALELFDQVESACNGGTAPSAGPAPRADFRGVHISLGDGGAKLCRRARRGLATSLVASGLERLDAAIQEGASARQAGGLVDRALGMESAALDAAQRAVALFVRGTANLTQGVNSGAERDLRAALDGKLPSAIQPLAQNNLGVALRRLDRPGEARRQFEAAQRSGGAPPAAALNLGIVLDEAGLNGEALDSYQRYVDAGGPRQGEVKEWIDRLRRMTP